MNAAENTAADTNEATGAATQEIIANFDNKVDKKAVKFNFRPDKDLGTKRAAVELNLLTPTVEGIIAILQAGGKQLDLLLDSCANVIIDQARSLLNDDDKITGDANFPFDKVTWEAISEIPPKERRGGGIPKETWEEFRVDYVAVMPAATGKTPEQIGNAAKLLIGKFQACKTAKPVISLLKDQLTIYVEQSPNAEQFVECVTFLVEKADTLLNMDEATLLSNL